MKNKEEILQAIKNSKIFNQKMKNDLILYFDNLNIKQKKLLIETLEKEKIILLNFLKTLKDKEIISFEEIKNNIEKLQREKRKQNESQEEKNKEQELDFLINSLENF